MFRFIAHILSGIATLGIALLILIQKDVDGALLINGWHGLGLACILLVILGVVQLTAAVSQVFEG